MLEILDWGYEDDFLINLFFFDDDGGCDEEG